MATYKKCIKYFLLNSGKKLKNKAITLHNDTITSIDIRTTMSGTKVLSISFNDMFGLNPENNMNLGNGHHFILDATQVISLSKLMQQAVKLLDKLDYLSDNVTLDTDVDSDRR